MNWLQPKTVMTVSLWLEGRKNITRVLKHHICEYVQHDIILFVLQSNLRDCVLYIIHSLAPLRYGFGTGKALGLFTLMSNYDAWWMVILWAVSWQPCSKTAVTEDGSKRHFVTGSLFLWWNSHISYFLSPTLSSLINMRKTQ